MQEGEQGLLPPSRGCMVTLMRRSHAPALPILEPASSASARGYKTLPHSLPIFVITWRRKKQERQMGSVCAEQMQQHKLHHSHQLYLSKKSLREIDIPPRKLLARRGEEMFVDSPKGGGAVFAKFLPCNSLDDDDDSDPYASDNFRMYEFKVRKCNRSRSHDWTDCPFAHPGEKARRRDPRRFHYSGSVCSEFRKGHCGKGDNCEFAHGVFECWLHPSRYRTEACKDGKNCKRKVCFFAHSSRQLRILPENPPSPPHERFRNCCVFCHSVGASPTSTLMGMSRGSPPLSPPPISPEFSPYGDSRFNAAGISYKEALNDLMSSFDAMNVAHHDGASSASNNPINLPWLDVNFTPEDQSQFVLSPSPLSPRRFHSNPFPVDPFSRNPILDGVGAYTAAPDLGWVNDLLT